jgi:hypothetical protein
MSQNIFTPSQNLTREQRWEERRRAKFSQPNQYENIKQTLPDTEIKAAPFSPSLQQQYAKKTNFVPPNSNYIPPNPAYIPTNSNYIPANPNYIPTNPNYMPTNPNYMPTNPNYIPANPNYIPDNVPQGINTMSVDPPNTYFEKKAPQSNSFFTNPVSDAEDKRRKLLQDYKTEAKRFISMPIKNQRERPLSRTQVIEQDTSKDLIKKKNYAYELQQQIEEKKKKKGSISVQQDYFPFGKPGAGAPFRDSQGNIIAARPPKYNENDPKFLSPNEFYRKFGSFPNSYSQPQFSNIKQDYQEVPPQYPPYAGNNSLYNPGYPPDYNQYASYINQIVPNAPQKFNQNMYSSEYSNPNNQRSLELVQTIPPQYNPYVKKEDYRERLDNTIPKVQPANSSSNSPGRENQEIQDEYGKSVQHTKKIELAKTLLEQMEEKKRKKEEEKRQRILEERLEEERLARQRREMEEEFNKEAFNKRKKIQEVQEFNSKVHVIEQPKIQRKPRTPIDFPQIEMPPPMSLGPKSNDPEPKLHIFQEIPLETANKIQLSMDSEIVKLKNDLESKQNDLKNEIYKMKTETQLAHEQRYEAQRELERLREEVKQKSIEEDIRQKELLMALINTKNTVYDTNTRLPAYKPIPYKLPQSKSEASLSLDSNKSLPSKTKLVPLANIEINFPTKFDKDSNLKKALELDNLFPSLPDTSNANISIDRAPSANSSIGLDVINKKNEKRLNYLEKIEGNTADELNKLDDILFKYLKDGNTRKLDSAPKRPTKELKLMSIEEDPELSLPRSANSEISLKWFKD